MPDRIIRDELLESHRWLGLKDNADRVAFICLLLTADDLGNLQAHPVRLFRLWRDYGIDTPAKVAKVLAELQDCDLIRCYEVDGQSYIHIPRSRQRLRYFNKKVPPSPWNQDIVEKKTDSSQTEVGLKSAEVKRSEVKRSEVKRSEVKGGAGGKAPDSSRRAFRAPSIQEVETYVKSKSYPVDPERFVDHYTANGWKVGKNPMKDWQAAVRTWAKTSVSSHAQPQATSWWQSEQETERIAKQLGMAARPGESWAQFRSRINDRLKEANHG
jgi:hypothetical protein